MTSTTYARCPYCGRMTRTEAAANGRVRMHRVIRGYEAIWLVIDCQA